jgi:hypothetical protein
MTLLIGSLVLAAVINAVILCVLLRRYAIWQARKDYLDICGAETYRFAMKARGLPEDLPDLCQFLFQMRKVRT